MNIGQFGILEDVSLPVVGNTAYYLHIFTVYMVLKCLMPFFSHYNNSQRQVDYLMNGLVRDANGHGECCVHL